MDCKRKHPAADSGWGGKETMDRVRNAASERGRCKNKFLYRCLSASSCLIEQESYFHGFLLFDCALGFCGKHDIIIKLLEKSKVKGLTRQARYIKIFMLYDYNEPTSPGARL
ncbi:MAG TPA: hypothetical protein DIT32_08625 [Peptococcaceae bacterium]|nr:hypothetical protein [Peptococcaceae bacterium]